MADQGVARPADRVEIGVVRADDTEVGREDEIGVGRALEDAAIGGMGETLQRRSRAEARSPRGRAMHEIGEGHHRDLASGGVFDAEAAAHRVAAVLDQLRRDQRNGVPRLAAGGDGSRQVKADLVALDAIRRDEMEEEARHTSWPPN